MKTLTFLLFALVLPVSAASIELTGTIRDFACRNCTAPSGFSSHPDFQWFDSGFTTGLVSTTLPGDKRPVYVATPNAGAITSAATFDQWYRDVAGVNQSVDFTISLEETAPGSGTFQYLNNAFFPINNQLLGNQGFANNYHFTYSINAEFTYVAGQTFQFSGDDDVWVYIDNNLVIDLGGTHSTLTRNINLDTLGLNPGQNYDLDFFFAERFCCESNFSISTTIGSIDNTPEVPEPATALFSLTGVAGLWLLKRNRRA
ncbi:MAG: fibro-slime domain-containing protein [Bryobacteraceae bacterium]|nr:fibro-slime domain-containing protein [Bryobacteraceae bacterium]